MVNDEPKLHRAAHLINDIVQENLPKVQLLNQNATRAYDPTFIEASAHILHRLLDPLAKKA